MNMNLRHLATSLAIFVTILASAQDWTRLPKEWKWVNGTQVAFSYDGSFRGEHDFVMNSKDRSTVEGIDFSQKWNRPPFVPEGAVNLTFSPDSTKMAFTRDNDLWVVDVETRQETRLTDDGSDVILNGYASWVYYEEILGRPSRYRAFWWSPDSKKVGFYRFDNTLVPVFPIYSSFEEEYDRSGMGLSYSQKAGSAVPLEGVSPTGGSVRMTRYPKCGDANPKVRIGIADVATKDVVWADFDENEDQYFGTPFWGADSRSLFIQREPRTQNTLDLYAVSVEDGSKQAIYHETYKTWLDWIEGMVFGRDGLYMVRSFETEWQQIYYLSYDGKICRRLTSGQNWRVSILDVDEGKATKGFDGTSAKVFFLGEVGSRVRSSLCAAYQGNVNTLTPVSMHASRVALSPDMKKAVCLLGNSRTPDQLAIIDFSKVRKNALEGKVSILMDSAEGMDLQEMTLPQLVTMTTRDGFELPALMALPKNFDKNKKYPVHMDIYGGPDTPMVIDSWKGDGSYSWYAGNGIIEIVADCRAAGHNGRAGLDQIYRKLSEREVLDFVEWADWLKALPYVDGDRIGVEGFSFGGTMTSLLVMDHPDSFHYGIAGGGVYDWALYDTHYTERFMDTPANNPEGYSSTRAVNHACNYVVKPGQDDGSVMLKITHGTGDDNVHFQNTLMLVDALQKAGCKFELMIYPDGMHGYRGYQGAHFNASNREFWLRYLKGE